MLDHYALIQKIVDHTDKPCFAADILDVLMCSESLAFFGITDADQRIVEEAYSLVLQCYKNNPGWFVQPIIKMTPRVF